MRRYLRVHRWSVQKVEDDTIHIKLHSWRERSRNQTKMLGIQAGLIGGGTSALGSRGMLTELSHRRHGTSSLFTSSKIEI